MAVANSRYAELYRTATTRNRSVVALRCDVHEACPICLADMYGRRVFITSCGHVWHLRCHHDLIAYEYDTCCMCRSVFVRAVADDDPSLFIDFE